MTRNTQVEKMLEGLFPGSQARAALAQGGWVIEILDSSLSQFNRSARIKAIETAITNTPSSSRVFWKVFLYRNSRDRYLIDGMLHTEPRNYTTDGHPIISLGPRDAVVRLTEFDGELLLLANYNGLEFPVIESMSTASTFPISPYSSTAKYLWLETQGGQYGLDPQALKVVTQTHPMELILKLNS